MVLFPEAYSNLPSFIYVSPGSSDVPKVFQTPSALIRSRGESLVNEIQCSHSIANYDVILWYKHDGRRTLKLLGFLNRQYPSFEDDVKGKVNFTGDGQRFSNFSISNLTVGDSAVYYCAASQHGAAEPPPHHTKTLPLFGNRWDSRGLPNNSLCSKHLLLQEAATEL